MNAAVVDSFSAPPRYATFSEPSPQSGELLVTVTAAGLHPIVKALASGKHYGSTAQFPFIPGLDGVGRLADGSRVFFAATHRPWGSFAERTLTTRAMSLPVPGTLDDSTVAALMNPGMSSWAALSERAHFHSGESVLIQGATGSAGRLAVQICKRRGASQIVVTGRDAAALDELHSLGADAVIHLTQERPALVTAFREALATRKVDVILDYLWGPPAEALLEAIGQKGLDHETRRIRYIQIGSAAGATIPFPAATLRSSGLEILGSGFGSVPIDRIFASLAAFLDEAARESFDVRVNAVPLRDLEKFWNAPENARIVFQP